MTRAVHHVTVRPIGSRILMSGWLGDVFLSVTLQPDEALRISEELRNAVHGGVAAGGAKTDAELSA